LRRNTQSGWDPNFVLLSGEPGVETDTGQMKVGNGVTPWYLLPYVGTGTGGGGTGPTGPTFTQWVPSSSDIKVDTPTTITMTGGTSPANVTSLQSFNSAVQGINLQFKAPALTEVGAEIQAWIISSGNIYYFDLTYLNTLQVIVPSAGIVYTGTFTAGDFLSLYTDGTVINALQNGTLLTTYPIVQGVCSAEILMVAPTTDITITNLLFYPTGIKGPTGATGPMAPAIGFDGGNAGSSYPIGPVFDCGRAE
jgi:hypothetical protein